MTPVLTIQGAISFVQYVISIERQKDQNMGNTKGLNENGNGL